MKIVMQRVSTASVTVEGNVTGEIGKGYLLLVGVTQDDDESDVQKMADKVAKLRLFEDADEKMNLSIDEVGGSILSVSQFTLYANTKKGRRPSFEQAAKPELAKPLWELFNLKLQEKGLRVETGVFGAMMDVALVNDGPVTIVLDSKE